ncbi:chloroplastic group IIA intron splicing facilitator CRS1 chloroplastic-like, partial [Trifolium medium]|nr:chloroplastic group IIA intron splicing facilitator CRS1 chloroplastic-like [Trifolium medium]
MEREIQESESSSSSSSLKKRRSNTELAERLIPEHELRRLRSIALRMVERFSVGVAGITQELV